MVRAAFLAALLACPIFAAAAVEQPNWSGPYRICANKGELLKFGHMDLGIRFDTSNAGIAAAFRRALAFWSSVIDMSYYEDSSSGCSLAVVDGTPEVLHQTHNVARAQFTDLPNFQAWIAFDLHASEYMTAEEMYATAVHELGHIFGLRHNPNANSVMYYLDCDGTSSLDEADLTALSTRHTLRSIPRIPLAILR